MGREEQWVPVRHVALSYQCPDGDGWTEGACGSDLFHSLSISPGPTKDMYTHRDRNFSLFYGCLSLSLSPCVSPSRSTVKRFREPVGIRRPWRIWWETSVFYQRLYQTPREEQETVGWSHGWESKILLDLEMLMFVAWLIYLAITSHHGDDHPTFHPISTGFTTCPSRPLALSLSTSPMCSSPTSQKWTPVPCESIAVIGQVGRNHLPI